MGTLGQQIDETLLFSIHNIMIVVVFPWLFLTLFPPASLPPRSIVRYSIDSCVNDESTMMEFSRSLAQS